MVICIIHGAVHYSLIAKLQNIIKHGWSKMNLHYPWIVEYIMCEQITIDRCDATETGGKPPVTMTNDTTPPPWRRQAALV